MSFQDEADEPTTPRETKAVEARIANPTATQKQLAAELGMTTRGWRKLMARERVQRALDAASRRCLDRTAALLARGAEAAGEALVAMALGKRKASTARVAAARAVIAGARETVSLVDLTRRVERIERDRRTDTEGLPQ